MWAPQLSRLFPFRPANSRMEPAHALSRVSSRRGAGLIRKGWADFQPSRRRRMTEQLFLVTRSRGPRWDDSRPMEKQEEWPAHAEFMNSLERDGFVVLGGPISGTRDVLLVIRAPDEAQIQARLSRDPWSRNKLLCISEIRAWTLRLGSIPHRAP